MFGDAGGDATIVRDGYSDEPRAAQLTGLEIRIPLGEAAYLPARVIYISSGDEPPPVNAWKLAP